MDEKNSIDKILSCDRGSKDLKICFISPPTICSKNQIRRVQPPLGIACLAAVLENFGFRNINVIDASAEGYDEIIDVGNDFIQFGLNKETSAEKVKKLKPDVVGISALFSSQISCAIDLSREIKKVLPDCIVVFGGIHASKKSNELLNQENSINYIISGEADYSFTLFCSKIEQKEDVTTVPGIVWRDGSTIKSNPQSPGLDMNDLPMPAWHLMDMEMYYEIGMPHNPFMKSREFLTVMTERGCPEKCYFCSSASFFGNSGKFRAMTADTAFKMIEYAVGEFGIKELQIEDDTFTLNPKRVIEFCKKVKHFGLRITLPNAIRADAPINRDKRLEMFQHMVEAGFTKVGISAEHGDQEFLDKVVGKRLDLEEVVASVELGHKAGLMVHTNFMMGFPFENEKHRNKTINFSKSLNSDSFSVSLAAPLPGTKLWDVCEKHSLFMPQFDVNRLVYDVVNIIPFDITPDDLLKTVINLNAELNHAARQRSNAANDHYKLFKNKGKNASGDRKYSSELKSDRDGRSYNDLKFNDSHGSVVPKPKQINR